MVNIAGLLARRSFPKVQEQVEDSSNNPPAYKGCNAPNPTLLDQERLCVVLEDGRYELANSHYHQNVVIHHLGSSMHEAAIFLRELARMVGSPFRPEELGKVS